VPDYPIPLFEPPPGTPHHWFYIRTNMSSYKAGHAKDTHKRAKKDRQFKGTIEVGKIGCNCPLAPDKYGHPMCDRERNWQDTHKRAHLPDSEWYRETPGVVAALTFMFHDDKRAMAIVMQVMRNNRPEAM
jgi:hypothetical protein